MYCYISMNEVEAVNKRIGMIEYSLSLNQIHPDPHRHPHRNIQTFHEFLLLTFEDWPHLHTPTIHPTFSSFLKQVNYLTPLSKRKEHFLLTKTKFSPSLQSNHFPILSLQTPDSKNQKNKFKKITTAMASPTLKLNSGHEMPQVGFGLWKVDNATCADTVYNAIKTGYRLFDGACGESPSPHPLNSQHQTQTTNQPS